ncbi:MAG: serine/threonine protein phosphatase [Bacteroidales bacterium]|nr:serine/threonine protein phosphatase [Bacteroidales bacterium]
MKILHISDTHGFHADMTSMLPEADILVHSGDFTWGGSEEEAFDFMNWLIELPYRNKIFIAGNHDACMYQADGIQGLPDNVHFLQHSSVIIDGIKFYGLPLYMEDYMSGRYDLYINEIPLDTDVLISHQPPYGILDITDYGNGPMNHGSKTLRDIIGSLKPKAHLFGHEHSAHGIIEKDNIVFSNGSVLDDNYKQDFVPRIIELG